MRFAVETLLWSLTYVSFNETLSTTPSKFELASKLIHLKINSHSHTFQNKHIFLHRDFYRTNVSKTLSISCQFCYILGMKTFVTALEIMCIHESMYCSRYFHLVPETLRSGCPKVTISTNAEEISVVNFKLDFTADAF